MIRTLETTDADQVFELMGEVYSNHSFLDRGMEAYKSGLETGSYVSLGDFEGSRLRAHAGFQVLANYALINALVVDPRYRSLRLGRSIFDARLAHIISQGSFDFVVGFSMMQHIKSQRLYDNDFKPIGVEIGYPDIYRGEDTAFNRGYASNAELVLCRRLSDRPMKARVTLPQNCERVASKILKSVGVAVEFSDARFSDDDEAVFLGFHPDAESGLFTPAFLAAGSVVDFDGSVASNHERHSFVDEVRGRYERAT